MPDSSSPRLFTIAPGQHFLITLAATLIDDCLLVRQATFAVTPLLRERLGAPCDTGKTRTELLAAFPQLAVWHGFAELPEVHIQHE